MNQDRKPMATQGKVIVAAVVLIIIVGLVGWLIGRSGNKPTNTTNQTQTGNTSGTDVKSLVSYTLPDAWREGTCPAASNTVYINPNGTSLNCNADPSAPIKVYVDPQNTTDCQQLKPTSNSGIKKHVCISLYIGGHKSLKASTTHSGSTDTTTDFYYVNTGKGVVAYEYTYTSANSYQAGFDQLATSTKVKG